MNGVEGREVEKKKTKHHTTNKTTEKKQITPDGVGEKKKSRMARDEQNKKEKNHASRWCG